MKRFLLIALIGCCFATGSAQTAFELWTDISETALIPGQKRIHAKNYRSLSLNENLLLGLLETAPMENTQDAKNNTLVLELPLPNGKMEQFAVVESPVMAPGLATRYPAIRTYAGRSLENGRSYLRFDITPKGFHAMILAGENTWFIDPFYHTNTGQYIAYYKKDFQTDQSFECLLASVDNIVDTEEKNSNPNPVGEELRTYRLAVAATGEYTQFHGGTVEGALAAIATTMNRVNGIYERDVSVRMILVDSNHLVIFTNGNSDPYSGGNTQRRNQNQEVIDSRIGPANYDIGHVFDTGGGGVASLGTVCLNGEKALGFTAHGQPYGDPFDVDYVAHEIGHQFDGNHTFNSCGGSGPVPYEPGSGTTIMAYAGICGSTNIQLNSDAHFHVANLDEIINFTLNAGGNTCAVITPTGNTPPLIDAGPGGYVIPISTPFELTASASDMEGDSLTFCWEQYDLGPSTIPTQPTGNAPLFRSFPPRNDSTRVFPRISAIVNNTNSTGEILPDYARNMRFRCTVRDNHGFGGGVDWDEITMSVTDVAGPFRVTSQNFGGTWTSGAYEIVTWNVSNTDQAPVNTPMVNIYLSIDGGFTYPITLAEHLPNIGEAAVLVPDSLVANNCRVKVKGAENVFFDINNEDFEIREADAPGFSTAIVPTSQAVCGGTPAAYQVNIAGLLGFSDTISITPIGDAMGLNLSLDTASLVPPATVNILVSETENVASGTYMLQLEAVSDTLVDTIALSLEVFASAPEAVLLTSPENGEINVPTFPSFSWEDLPEATSYTLEVSSEPGFTDLLFSESGITENFYTFQDQLVDSTMYFWRIRGANEVCGEGMYSEIYFFTTEVFRCDVFRAEDLPKAYTNFPFVSSRLEIEEDLSIRDVNILNIQGTKQLGENLEFQLRGADVTITLIPDECDLGTSYDISLDDESPLGNIPCPFTNGFPYKPEESLSAYDGLSAQGPWRLFVYNGGPPGELTNWELEICYGAEATPAREVETVVSEFNLFPNPTGDWVTVELALKSKKEVRLQLRNGIGQLLKQLDWGDLNQGVHRFDLDLGSFPKGLYFVQLISDKNELLKSGKLIKQ